MSEPDFPTTNKELAALLGVSERTITTWRRRFSPKAFESPRSLLAAVATLERYPPSAVHALRKLLGDDAADLNTQAELPADGTGDEAGVAATIRRLEASEREAWHQYQGASDPLSRKLACECWLKVAAELLRYERGVSLDKRKAGELIELDDARRSISVLSQCFFLALQRLALEHVEAHGDGLESITSFLQNAATMALPALGDFAPEGDLAIAEVNGPIRQCFVESFGTWQFQDMPAASQNRIALFEHLLEIVLAKSPEERAAAEKKIRALGKERTHE